MGRAHSSATPGVCTGDQHASEGGPRRLGECDPDANRKSGPALASNSPSSQCLTCECRIKLFALGENSSWRTRWARGAVTSASEQLLGLVEQTRRLSGCSSALGER